TSTEKMGIVENLELAADRNVRAPAQELLPAFFPLQGSRITDDAPYQAVVIGVGSIAEAVLKPLIKPVLMWPHETVIGDLDSEAFQPRSSDEDEQREIGHLMPRKIG
ncbi:MAG: hypothetical protein QOJ40_78, partial [Verrucomicrobiota bacterium]